MGYFGVAESDETEVWSDCVAPPSLEELKLAHDPKPFRGRDIAPCDVDNRARRRALNRRRRGLSVVFRWNSLPWHESTSLDRWHRYGLAPDPVPVLRARMRHAAFVARFTAGVAVTGTGGRWPDVVTVVVTSHCAAGRVTDSCHAEAPEMRRAALVRALRLRSGRQRVLISRIRLVAPSRQTVAPPRLWPSSTGPPGVAGVLA
jgi:hypothetical protein